MDYEIGSVVNGTVAGITKFGAFVDLPDGTRGLVHISEISQDYISSVSDVLTMGQNVKVKILSKNGEKTELSIRRSESGATEKRVFKKKLDKNDEESISGGRKNFNWMMKKFEKESSEVMKAYNRSRDPHKKRNRIY
ncbi:MAG: S1 RNA-binding domain-containing protein [Oscillospiraceae bacterium]|jgi:S1 RNA binding domain protein|nr:S1 RNA-binding domain-containing protein [Oscillospiraceae bacterium]